LTNVLLEAENKFLLNYNSTRPSWHKPCSKHCCCRVVVHKIVSLLKLFCCFDN
jgi:hypothetical protein